MNNFDPSPFIGQNKNQHFDRKSLFEDVSGQKKACDSRAVCEQVAEYVAAFANSEGGVFILGLEDDGAVTGHAFASDDLETLVAVPETHLEPAQAPGFVVEYQGFELVVFDVVASDVPVQVIGGGFPLRIDNKIQRSNETRILARKSVTFWLHNRS